MYEIDNRNGARTIYFISDIAPFCGSVEIGQVSTSVFDSVQYTDRDKWLSDLKVLGIEFQVIEIDPQQPSVE